MRTPIKPAKVIAGLTLVTHEYVQALPSLDHLHPICHDPKLISADRDGQKYSQEMWRLIQRALKWAKPQENKLVCAPNPTTYQRRIHREARKHVRTSMIGSLRWLLIADTNVGTPDLMTGGTLVCSLAGHEQVDEDGLLTRYVGAPARRLESFHERRVEPCEFIDVTDLFWEQYLRFGRCAKNDMGFREVHHNWQQITRTSKRCACCGMWSYRRTQRTVVARKHDPFQERKITQVPVWEHQVSKQYATDPYLKRLRQLPTAVKENDHA